MGQKVHPYAFRLGFIKNWKSRWFTKKKYKELLEQDCALRSFILKKLSRTGVNSVEIERSANFINVIIQTARPGLVIGRGGAGIEELKKEIKQVLSKKDSSWAKTEIKLEVEEIRDPSSHAAVMASDICLQIEKRMPYRRVMKQIIDKIMQSREVKGAKIMISGRLNGAEIARREWLKEGRIPLQTLRSDIDYAQATAYTTYGTIGVKVWIYKGEILKTMLQPKKVKHRKWHKGRRRTKGNDSRGTEISFGSYGLKAVEPVWLTARQIEAARRAMTRYVQRGGKIWIRVFPDKPRTKKGAETPMGGGKGSVDHYIAALKPGRIIFEMDGVSEETAKEAMRRAAHKLPVKTKFVKK